VKILVPFKRVPAPETKIRLRPDGAGIETDGVTFVINPFDEIALEEALRIRERAGVEAIVAVTIGPEECAEPIRTALGMGADRAIHVLIADTGMDEGRQTGDGRRHSGVDPSVVRRPSSVVPNPQSAIRNPQSQLDSLEVAKILEAIVRRETPDLVLMGKQAIDDDANQAGQMLAARLRWPQATFVSKLELLREGTWAECTRETDAGLETTRVRLPAVITTDLRLNEPRYVSLPGIMRARAKPVETLSCADLGLSVSLRALIHSLVPPPSRPRGTRVASVEALLRLLHEEARVV
jgi:electron transfer flavoprotein beta subunit